MRSVSWTDALESWRRRSRQGRHHPPTHPSVPDDSSLANPSKYLKTVLKLTVLQFLRFLACEIQLAQPIIQPV